MASSRFDGVRWQARLEEHFGFVVARQLQATHRTGGLTDEQVALLGDHLA